MPPRSPGDDWYGGLDAVLHPGSTLEAFVSRCDARAASGGGATPPGKGGTEGADDDGGLEGADDDEGGGASRLRLRPRGECGDVRIHATSFQRAADEDPDAAAGEAGSEDDKSDAAEERAATETPAAHEPAATAGEAGSQDDHDESCDAATDGGAAEERAAAETSRASDAATAAAPPSPPTVPPLGRGFCFDLTPGLLFAAGDAVECLVKSGVSEYLEFKSLRVSAGARTEFVAVPRSEVRSPCCRRAHAHVCPLACQGLHLFMEEEARGVRRPKAGHNGSGRGRGGGAGAGDEPRAKLVLHRVPCSKGDVFRSKLLSPVDKRRLMKFLQLIADYGTATQFGDPAPAAAAVGDAGTADDGDAAAAADAGGGQNEEVIQTLNEQYLHRGRALSRPQNKATPASADMAALLRCVREGASFADYLTAVARLPARLAAVVAHALALLPGGAAAATGEGVDALVRHLTALGRFGDTAFLVTMYGTGELSQAFCRSGAVYGATYMLRRAPAAVSCDADGRVRGVVLAGEARIGEEEAVDTEDVVARTHLCEHVVVPRAMLARPAGRARVYRRVSILAGKLIAAPEGGDDKDGLANDQRYAIVVPPGTPGLGNTTAIHGVAVDESAFVAPRDCTVLHLTTSSLEDDTAPDEFFVDMLKRTVEFLVASQSHQQDAAHTAADASRAVELHYVSFSHAVEAPSAEEHEPPRPGLHVCRRGAPSLTCDAAFREARRIFRNICPESDFLAVAQQVEDAIVHREADDSDDEKNVLESACTMIQAPTLEATIPEANASAVV